MQPSIFQQIVLPHLRTLRFPSFCDHCARSTGIRPTNSISRPIRGLSSTVQTSRASSSTDVYSSGASSSTYQPSLPRSLAPRQLATDTPAWESQDDPASCHPPLTLERFQTGRDPPGYPDRPTPFASRTSERHGSPGGENVVEGRGGSGVAQERERDRAVARFMKLLQQEEGTRRETMLLALERISAITREIGVGSVERSSEEEKGQEINPKQVATSRESFSRKPDLANQVDTNDSGALVSASMEQITATAQVTRIHSMEQELFTSPSVTLPRNHRIPAAIHKLLSSRLYRLATHHILATPEYSAQMEILDQVIHHLETAGAKKEVQRLRKRREEVASIADPAENVALAEDIEGASASNPTAITKLYNSHLTRALFGIKHRSSSLAALSLPPPPRFDVLRSPLPRPTAGYHQLRVLLERIDVLVKHRGFKPDWITGNLVVRCWLECWFAARADRGDSGSSGRDGKTRSSWGDLGAQPRTLAGSRLRGNKVTGDVRKALDWLELRGLFDFVALHFERQLELTLAKGKPERRPIPVSTSSALHRSSTGDNTALNTISRSSVSSSSSPAPDVASQLPRSTSSTAPDSRLHKNVNAASSIDTDGLSYIRHVRPFSKTVSRAMRDAGDMQGAEKVYEWQKRMRGRIEHLQDSLPGM